jgi:hypothetical protein
MEFEKFVLEFEIFMEFCVFNEFEPIRGKLCELKRVTTFFKRIPSNESSLPT